MRHAYHRCRSLGHGWRGRSKVQRMSEQCSSLQRPWRADLQIFRSVRLCPITSRCHPVSGNRSVRTLGQLFMKAFYPLATQHTTFSITITNHHVVCTNTGTSGQVWLDYGQMVNKHTTSRPQGDLPAAVHRAWSVPFANGVWVRTYVVSNAPAAQTVKPSRVGKLFLTNASWLASLRDG